MEQKGFVFEGEDGWKVVIIYRSGKSIRSVLRKQQRISESESISCGELLMKIEVRIIFFGMVIEYRLSELNLKNLLIRLRQYKKNIVGFLAEIIPYCIGIIFLEGPKLWKKQKGYDILTLSHVIAL